MRKDIGNYLSDSIVGLEFGLRVRVEGPVWFRTLYPQTLCIPKGPNNEALRGRRVVVVEVNTRESI